MQPGWSAIPNPRSLTASAAGKAEDEPGIDVTSLTSSLGFLVRLTQQAMYEEFHRRVGSNAVTPARYSVMCLLRDNPASSMTALAACLRIKPSNFAVLIQDLEKHGLVERRLDTMDRRRNLVRLTPDGENALRTIEPSVDVMEAGYRHRLGPTALLQLKAGLRRLLADMDESG